MTSEVDKFTQTFMDKRPLLSNTLKLSLPDAEFEIHSNSETLLQLLKDYFAHIVADEVARPISVIAIESEPDDLGLAWQDWFREPGKKGRKDSYVDLPGMRLIRKVRTGMVFMQSLTSRIAIGPCLQNANQVINFINNQYMNLLQHQGWLICHAAALAGADSGIAVAGFSGGGKSTLSLHLMTSKPFKFVSNDRAFIRMEGKQVMARGIPKLPRINPGTIVNNPKLRSMFSPEQIAEFEAMPIHELWELEQKYDVDITATFGEGRITTQTRLSVFIVLNWSHRSTEPTRIQEVNLEKRGELLQAIMKSSGPFFQHADGQFNKDSIACNPEPYQDILGHIPVFEATGTVDFEQIKNFCLSLPMATD